MRSPTHALGLAAIAILLAGCAPMITLQPAADAVNPLCAEVIVHLPDEVADLPARETDAQATGAWGEPASVLLRCGVAVPAPTAEFPCVTVDGVDWLRDDSDDPNFVFTTYGRDPAIEVVIDSGVVSGLEALTELSAAISRIPSDGACVALGD